MPTNAEIMAQLDAAVALVRTALTGTATTTTGGTTTGGTTGTTGTGGSTGTTTGGTTGGTTTGTSTLTIVASARVFGDPPHAEVKVDGVSIGKWDVTALHDSGGRQTISVPGTFDPTKAHTVEIAFTNSNPANGQWSMMFVHSVTLNGVTIQGPAATNTAAGNNQAADFNTAVMTIPGSATFKFPASSNTGSTTTTGGTTTGGSTGTTGGTTGTGGSTGTTASSKAVKLVVAGDSIGCGSVNGADPMPPIVALLPFPTTVKNFSVGGAYMGQHCQINFATEMQAYDPTVTCIWMLQAGTNDLTQGAQGDDMIGTAKTAFAQAKTAGFKTAVCTILPRLDSGIAAWTPAMETQRLRYNSQIRAGATGADFIIDLAADPTMGALTAPGDTTLYIDKLHPTVNGANTILCKVYAKAISSFILGS